MISTTWVYGLLLLLGVCAYWLSRSRRPRHLSQSAIWVWARVALCLVAIDLLFFRVGLLWHLPPHFSSDLGGENTYFLFAAAREFETQRAALGKTDFAGSSVIIFGADEGVINARLRAAGVPPLLRLTTYGSDATDTALLVWNSLPAHPWLVVYGAAFRDFPKTLPPRRG
jgi:hypothetical protein